MFCVTPATVKQHPRSWYEDVLAWLMDPQTRDDMSSRVTEWTYHLLFAPSDLRDLMQRMPTRAVESPANAFRAARGARALARARGA
mmetsp:Transcript_28798/g.91979  ORF Transcript_28798/g.91979 Transcript_28798/m.91979 type:complete len:86 (-) Transcript_28798:138-395(-)